MKTPVSHRRFRSWHTEIEAFGVNAGDRLRLTMVRHAKE